MMSKCTFSENQLATYFVITVMCAVVVTSSGCGRVGAKLGKQKPQATPVQPRHSLANPTRQLTQQPQPLIPPFEMPVTGQGLPTFQHIQQPQPLVRSFVLPVGQGTPRPATNPRIPRNDQNIESQASIVDDVVDAAGKVFDDWARNEMREQQRQRLNPQAPGL
jgi:hypothetical protein